MKSGMSFEITPHWDVTVWEDRSVDFRLRVTGPIMVSPGYMPRVPFIDVHPLDMPGELWVEEFEDMLAHPPVGHAEDLYEAVVDRLIAVYG